MSWRHTLFFILNNTSPPHRDTGLQHLALPPCWIRLDPFNTAPISGYVTTGDQKQRAHLCPLTPTAGSGSIPKIRMHSWPPRPPPPPPQRHPPPSQNQPALRAHGFQHSLTIHHVPSSSWPHSQSEGNHAGLGWCIMRRGRLLNWTSNSRSWTPRPQLDSRKPGLGQARPMQPWLPRHSLLLDQSSRGQCTRGQGLSRLSASKQQRVWLLGGRGVARPTMRQTNQQG